MCTLCSLNSIFALLLLLFLFLSPLHSLHAPLPLFFLFHCHSYLFTLLLNHHFYLSASLVFLLSFSTTPVPCFLWMVHFSLHPFSIHPNDLVSLQAELLLLDGTSAQWRHTPLSPPALSVYGVSPFVVSHLPIAQ